MAKTGYKDFYCAMIDDNNNIVTTSLILLQRIFLNTKMAYAPRGFLIDFQNNEIFDVFVGLLKNYLRKKKVAYLKIDPPITHIDRNNEGKPTESPINSANIIEHLKQLGFQHTGFNLYFENLKARWNSILSNCSNANDVFNSFDKSTKTKIRSAERKGVTIYKGTKDDIKLFYGLVDKVHTRKIGYYYKMLNIFGRFNMFDIYFAIIDPSVYLKNSKLLYENELQRNAELNEKMQANIDLLNEKMDSDKLVNLYKNEVIQANELYKQNKRLVVATTAIIKYGNEIFFLIDGVDKNNKSFNANYLLKWKIIETVINNGFDTFHLNGITGDFNPKSKYYGLFNFKSGFNTKVVEYIGEFNLVINKFRYRTYKRFHFFKKRV
jgi:lipid II:glycine glycyltransferase (peptidoglycan interpeptide bridge formation enzyme)